MLFRSERFAFWLTSLTYKDATEITINCKQKYLYTLLGVQRSSFIKTMGELKEQGILDYSTNEIVINDRNKLVEILTII